jgi:D-alanyl-D-alanine dipeptidase
MKKVTRFIYFFTLVTPLLLSCGDSVSNTVLPEGFVDVKQMIPSLQLELRYATTNNFIGQPINGYIQPRCILTRDAAVALAKVQKELTDFSLSLKIFDAYRPQRAVDHFVRWAKDTSDTLMKKYYYPNVQKKNLFRDGYIADKSSHSRGSTVDLTIIPLIRPIPSNNISSEQSPPPVSLDMGSAFDLFDPVSHTVNPDLKTQQRVNRLLLKTLMEKHGFRNYSKEWWHFTLIKEPFPDTYFDFPIR